MFWSSSLSKWLVCNCEIWGSCSGVADDPILVGCDAVLSSDQFLMFQRILVPSSWKSSRPWHCKWSKCLWNVGHYLCKNTLSHPRRVEIWSDVSFLAPINVGSSMFSSCSGKCCYVHLCFLWYVSFDLHGWHFSFLESSTDWKQVLRIVFCIWNFVK